MTRFVLVSTMKFSRMRAISNCLSPCITDQWNVNYPSWVSIPLIWKEQKLKKIIKTNICFFFSLLYLCIRSCKFFTRLRQSTWWERDEFINHSKYGQVKSSHRCSITKVFLKISQCLQENTCSTLFIIKKFKVTLKKTVSNIGVFLWILRNI